VLPDVPALAESGFPGFSALAWWGIFGTAGTPKPIIDKIHAELVKALNRPKSRSSCRRPWAWTSRRAARKTRRNSSSRRWSAGARW